MHSLIRRASQLVISSTESLIWSQCVDWHFLLFNALLPSTTQWPHTVQQSLIAALLAGHAKAHQTSQKLETRLKLDIYIQCYLWMFSTISVYNIIPVSTCTFCPTCTEWINDCCVSQCVRVIKLTFLSITLRDHSAVVVRSLGSQVFIQATHAVSYKWSIQTANQQQSTFLKYNLHCCNDVYTTIAKKTLY